MSVCVASLEGRVWSLRSPGRGFAQLDSEHTVLTAALALSLGVSLCTRCRCLQRVARLCFPCSGEAGVGGGASESLGSFIRRKSWKARPFLATSSDFFLSLKKKKNHRGVFLVGQCETQWCRRLTQRSIWGRGDPGFR